MHLVAVLSKGGRGLPPVIEKYLTGDDLAERLAERLRCLTDPNTSSEDRIALLTTRTIKRFVEAAYAGEHAAIKASKDRRAKAKAESNFSPEQAAQDAVADVMNMGSDLVKKWCNEVRDLNFANHDRP